MITQATYGCLWFLLRTKMTEKLRSSPYSEKLPRTASSCWQWTASLKIHCRHWNRGSGNLLICTVHFASENPGVLPDCHLDNYIQPNYSHFNNSMAYSAATLKVIAVNCCKAKHSHVLVKWIYSSGKQISVETAAWLNCQRKPPVHAAKSNFSYATPTFHSFDEQ